MASSRRAQQHAVVYFLVAGTDDAYLSVKLHGSARTLTECAPRFSIVLVAVLNGRSPVSSAAKMSLGFKLCCARKSDTIRTNFPICAAASSGANWAPVVRARCVKSWLQMGDSGESHHGLLPIQKTCQPPLACRKRRRTAQLGIERCRCANNCCSADGVS